MMIPSIWNYQIIANLPPLYDFQYTIYTLLNKVGWGRGEGGTCYLFLPNKLRPI